MCLAHLQTDTFRICQLNNKFLLVSWLCHKDCRVNDNWRKHVMFFESTNSCRVLHSFDNKIQQDTIESEYAS